MSLTVVVTLCVVAVVGATRQQDSFYFDPAPVSQDVVEGSSVRLRCDVSNRHQIAFYWTLNGKSVSNSSRRWQDGTDLRIAWVDRNRDSGSLRCIATNVTTGIALRSAAARLNILCKHHASSLCVTGPPNIYIFIHQTNGSVLFCSLMSVSVIVVCRL